MTAFVTDTHPLIFYATGKHKKLSPKSLRLFQQFEAGKAQLFVPAPVVLETWLLHRGGRIAVPTTLAAWWQELAAFSVVHVPLQAEDILTAAALDWSHNDIFDRLIVATARRLGLPLATRVAEILDSDLVVTF